MMKAMKCDYCGKFYEPYSGQKKFPKKGESNGLMLIDREVNGMYDERKSYDLCPNCMKKAATMLEGKDNE